MSTTQDIVDSLIDHIDKAITKGSVTNQQVAGVLDFLNERYKTLAKAGGSLSKDIRVTSPKTGNINPGDILKEGTTYESIFRTMLTSVESASLTGKLSTSNDVEFGTAKGQLTYTANRHGNGPMIKAFYDYIEENKLEFSAEVNGEQKAIRQLTGYYTMEETYAATVVYDASPDGVLPQITLNNKISVNVRRKWFAGVCNTVPQTSDAVRALSSNGLYTGPGTYKFPIGTWSMFAVCIPADMITELTLTSYPGNFIENGTEGPIKIMVEGANGSKAIEYKMWIAEATMPNDPDTFTFKTA